MLCKRFNCSSIRVAYPFGDRLSAEMQTSVDETKVFSRMLGIRGPSLRYTRAYNVERVKGDGGVDDAVFRRPIVRAARRMC